MGDLVEKVSRAVYQVSLETRDVHEIWAPDLVDAWCRDRAKPFARAAIAAVFDDLMEPTKEMEDAADPYPSGAPYEPGSPADVWRAMITAKRKEVLGDD